jgi:hypothetical protein
MTALRSIGRTIVDLFAYGWSTGRWWLPLVTVAFALAVVLAVTAKTVIAPALYILF